MNHSTPAGVGSSGGREKYLYGMDGKGEKMAILRKACGAGF